MSHPPLDQLDLFAGAKDKTVSTTATPATTGTGEAHPYSVERLPNGYTRITQHGRVTFNGLIGRASA